MEGRISIANELHNLYTEVKSLLNEATFGMISVEKQVLIKTINDQIDVQYELLKKGAGSISDMFILKLLLKTVIQTAKKHEC